MYFVQTVTVNLQMVKVLIKDIINLYRMASAVERPEPEGDGSQSGNAGGAETTVPARSDVYQAVEWSSQRVGAVGMLRMVRGRRSGKRL